MNNYFADLHIHIGMTESGQWIKIPTSKKLTLRNILDEAKGRKGLQIVGIVDAMSPAVQQDIVRLLEEQILCSLPGGGYRYDSEVTLVLGAEIETCEEAGGLCHTLLYLPDLPSMQALTKEMSKHIKNINMSSQNAHMCLNQLVKIGLQYQAQIIPAHIFTPFKSMYGATARRMSEILTERDIAGIAAIELGLSADSNMADRIQELAPFTFLTNSDAHSIDKIAREYNVLRLKQADYSEVVLALYRKEGRCVAGNYGLDPRLGKYHRSICKNCGNYIEETVHTGGNCSICSKNSVVKGVAERIAEIADSPSTVHPSHRPVYNYQIPLEYIPGLGKKTLLRLLDKYQNEMSIIHQASFQELSYIIGESMAKMILACRNGEFVITEGGGGLYGKLKK